MPNALVDIPWIHTTAGSLTVKETLIRAHEIEGLDLNRPAYEVGATLRFLSSFFAVVGQEHYFLTNSWNPTDFDEGIPPELISNAIERIGKAALLEDSKHPFLQQPVIESQNPDYPVKKLFPTILSDQANSFWNFATDNRQSLPVDEAVLALCVYYNYMPVGNSKYGGRKCKMGSPGFHFTGMNLRGLPQKPLAVTELVWLGETLLETLLLATPLVHITTRSLPAWADRDYTLSGNPTENGEAPLWRATWTSNAPACKWDKDFNLTAIRSGGVPTNWEPPSSRTTELKAWWDERNVLDPFYLFIRNTKGKPVPVQFDIGLDLVSIAVDWLAESKYLQLRSRCNTLKSPDDQDILALRHIITGKAASPSIRSSTCLQGDSRIWSPKGSESIVEEISGFANLIATLHSIIKQPFESDKTNSNDHDSLLGIKADISSEFWSRIETTFYSCMRDYDPSSEDFRAPSEAISVIHHGTMDAFDAVMDRYIIGNQLKKEAIRARTSAKINRCVKRYRRTYVDPLNIDDLL